MSGDPLVDARQVVAHLGRLRTAGMTPHGIARAAGLSRNAIVSLIGSDRQLLRTSTAAAIMAVEIPVPEPRAGSDWRADAACIDRPPELFYPETDAQEEAGKQVCFSCPARARCLDWAIHNGEDGTWGGLSRAERATLARRRRRERA